MCNELKSEEVIGKSPIFTMKDTKRMEGYKNISVFSLTNFVFGSIKIQA